MVLLTTKQSCESNAVRQNLIGNFPLKDPGMYHGHGCYISVLLHDN